MKKKISGGQLAIYKVLLQIPLQLESGDIKEIYVYRPKGFWTKL